MHLAYEDEAFWVIVDESEISRSRSIPTRTRTRRSCKRLVRIQRHDDTGTVLPVLDSYGVSLGDLERALAFHKRGPATRGLVAPIGQPRPRQPRLASPRNADRAPAGSAEERLGEIEFLIGDHVEVRGRIREGTEPIDDPRSAAMVPKSWSRTARCARWP